jgi:hypothetical protein
MQSEEKRGANYNNDRGYHSKSKSSKKIVHMHVIYVVWMDTRWQIIQNLQRCRRCSKEKMHQPQMEKR